MMNSFSRKTLEALDQNKQSSVLRKLAKLDVPDMQDTAGEAGTSS